MQTWPSGKSMRVQEGEIDSDACHHRHMSQYLTFVGVHGISNSVYDKPWGKVEYGKEAFTRILAKYTSLSQQDRLQDDLLSMLNDTTQ